jgi:hypothetical protein
MHYLLLYVKFLINYNSLRCQTFYDRGGRRAGIFMLDRSFFFHVSRKPFFFTHQVDQFIFDTYMRQTKFVKDLFAKFKQIFIKRRLVELKLYKKRWSVYVHKSEQQEHLFTLNIVCCLETNFLSLMSFSVTITIFLCSRHNSYCVLLGSVHIPVVLCYVWVSTCSGILNVYVASCFS